MSEVDTAADPLAIPVITHPLVVVKTIETLSPTSVNVTEVAPLRVSGVITETPPPSTSITNVTVCPATPSASAGVVEPDGVVTNMRPPVAVSADVADVYA